MQGQSAAAPADMRLTIVREAMLSQCCALSSYSAVFQGSFKPNLMAATHSRRCPLAQTAAGAHSDLHTTHFGDALAAFSLPPHPIVLAR